MGTNVNNIMALKNGNEVEAADNQATFRECPTCGCVQNQLNMGFWFRKKRTARTFRRPRSVNQVRNSQAAVEVSRGRFTITPRSFSGQRVWRTYACCSTATCYHWPILFLRPYLFPRGRAVCSRLGNMLTYIKLSVTLDRKH